jgi:hypothetical protein
MMPFICQVITKEFLTGGPHANDSSILPKRDIS